MNDAVRLVADIGGTNARFALATSNHVGFSGAQTLQCAEYANAVDAIRHYLNSIGAPKPTAVCLAAAGPVIDGALAMTNNHWSLSEVAISAALEVDQVRLINDFEALAWSLPHIRDADLEPIGALTCCSLPSGDFSAAIVGPGTGFGTAGLVRRGRQLIPLVGEGGHISFAPTNDQQFAVFDALHQRYGRVNVERLLSGAGIEAIYASLSALTEGPASQLSAGEVFVASRDGTDPIAREATDVFFEVLGQVAGDIALVLGASDGVYIAGGIAKRYPEMLRASGFRAAFEAKGRHQALMQKIPTCLITHEEPGLLGAASQV